MITYHQAVTAQHTKGLEFPQLFWETLAFEAAETIIQEAKEGSAWTWQPSLEEPKGKNIAQKITEAHLVESCPVQGEEMGIRIDHTLLQDATGTPAMLNLEALRIDRVRAERCVQYVDHNLLQTDSKNADDHRYLQSACAKFRHLFQPSREQDQPSGAQGRFGIPGKTLLGAGKCEGGFDGTTGANQEHGASRAGGG